MDLDYEYVRRRGAERIARSLAASGARAHAGTGCPLERLVTWITSRLRAKLDPAALAR